MKKAIILYMAFMFMTAMSYGQNALNALQYSQHFHYGTARSMAMGNSLGALGADLSTVSTNPAGIAVYRGFDMNISPVFMVNNADAKFLHTGNMQDDSRYKALLTNIGLVAAIPGDDDGWASINFGFSYNRQADFNSNLLIEGVNEESSLMDFITDNASSQGSNLFDYREQLFWDTYLLDKDDEGYFYSMPTSITQRKKISTEGSIGEYAFSLGANYSNWLYIGGTLGIHGLRHKSENMHREWDHLGQDVDYFGSYTFFEDILTTGTGFNFKVGTIIKPIKYVRLGAAIHTPTFYSLTEEYDTRLEVQYTGQWDPEVAAYYNYTPVDDDEYELLPLLTEYNVISPYKAIGSIALVSPKIGPFAAILTGEYEYIDYSLTRMRFESGDAEVEANDAIEALYTEVHNFKGGLDLKAGPMSLRGGVAYYGSPYTDAYEGEPADRLSYSAGIGLMGKHGYFDLTYCNTQYTETNFIYPVLEEQQLVGADITYNISMIVATFGIRF